jgi:hypothetical protein
LRELYRWNLAKAACFEEAGVPVRQAPPEQVYVDSKGEWYAEQAIDEDPNLAVSRAVLDRCARVEGRPAFVDW